MAHAASLDASLMAEEQARLDDWLVAAAPSIDAAEIRRYPGPSWVLDFDDGLIVQAQPDAERKQLVLTGSLGLPYPGTELAAYRMLLEIGAWWPVTGGMSLALDPDSGIILQIIDVALQDLDAAHLQASLATFLGRARHLRAALDGLQSMGPGAPAREAPWAEVLGYPGALRI
jgi:hypothetical protein